MKHLSINLLQSQYRSGKLTVRALMLSLQERMTAIEDPAIFIHWLSLEELEPYLGALEKVAPDSLPLYGIPFAIKDNIDLAGIPTTAACPDYRYLPNRSAYVVEQLIQAGAIPVGKTNLDQFATGLVGVRSPYGTPINPIVPDRIPGGSSSGSAVAVARGLASFALGTDTAGSGRVPAAFNELVGLKPSRGLLSTTGVVPACRSLDCVSIFANTLGDAQHVFEIATKRDTQDAYSRDYNPDKRVKNHKMRVGVPNPNDLAFFGDNAFEVTFRNYLETLHDLPNVELVEIDYQPFSEAAKLLYQGPWVAERYAAVGAFIESSPPSAIHPVTQKIILGGDEMSAVDTFRAFYQLQSLKQKADEQLARVDCILTPTAGRHYTVSEVLSDPIATNSNLGYYTNYMNLLDYAALAIPAGRTQDSRPFGVTLFSFAHQDEQLIDIAAYLSGENHISNPSVLASNTTSSDTIEIAVCGAHMKGMALNPQLQALGATFVKEASSSPNYQFVCLADKTPIRPGMIRVPTQGVSVEMEIWSLPMSQVGDFLSKIEAPLGLGSVELEDGTMVKGFVCEGWVADSAVDISSHRSWRRYLDTLIE